jgi:pyruvate, orthophosphate dikinase
MFFSRSAGRAAPHDPLRGRGCPARGAPPGSSISRPATTPPSSLPCSGRPVTVRLFDPPLHEFLPRSDEDIDETARSLGLAVRALKLRLERIEEVNPMLGHRGVPVAITYPEILEMQMQALLAGVREASRGQDEPVVLEVMVPFVSTAREVHWVRDRVMQHGGGRYPLRSPRAFAFGTMIELPRACARAEDIAASVDFFSFGTNDLTQTTYGISRDDAPAFLAAYQRKGLYEFDPFVTLDEKGVGELMTMAIERGKRGQPQPQDRHLRRACRRSGIAAFFPASMSTMSAARPTASPSPG